VQVGSPRQAIVVSWLARIHLPALSKESAYR
ncbi:putative phage protein, partial [Bordetella avium 197N]